MMPRKSTGSLTGTSSRRFTPYTKRPVQRILSVGSRKKQSIRSSRSGNSSVLSSKSANSSVQSLRWKQTDASIPTTGISGILKKSWKVYKASPLYKYSLQRQTIKRLTQGLQRSLLTPTVDVKLDRKFTVQFRIVDQLKVNKNDPDALMLTICEKLEASSKAVFCCVLCVVRDEEDNRFMPLLPENFVRVPVVLMKGTIAFSNKVKLCLEELFDCHIEQFKFCPRELAWMFAMWSGHVDSSKKNVRLLYSLPAEVQGMKSISYEIDACHCQELWQSMHGKGRKEILSHEVEAFMKSLQCHFKQFFQVNLAMCRLMEITTSSVAASNDGKLKIFSEEVIIGILRHITLIMLEEQEL